MDPNPLPFDRGAIYRAKVAFEAFRDHFDSNERLIYFRHAVSSYDSMEGWFFYVEGVPDRTRSWDIALGSLPPQTPFEKLADVAPIVRAAESGLVEDVSRLVRSGAIDSAFVRIALDAAIERGHAETSAAIVAHSGLSRPVQANALSEAAARRQLAVVRALLDAGVPAFDTAIWSAVWSGSTKIVELLIARGANPHRAGQSIASMIAFCDRQNHPDLARILRDLSRSGGERT